MRCIHPPAMLFVAAVLCAGRPAAADGQLGHFFEHAKQAIEDGDYDTALALMDKAVVKSPKAAKYRGLRGVALLCMGKYAKGAADLKEAIALNHGDAGAKKAASVKSPPSPDREKHGRLQVERMLRDRPAMNRHGAEADFLRRWAEAKFAGEDFGEPIDWDSSPPLHSDAEHLAPDGNDNAAIMIEEKYTEGPHRGQPRSFEELWAGAVFELYNVSFARDFIRFHEDAEQGKLTKEEFVGGILKLELLAAQQTRAFYLNQFLPFAAKKKLKTDPTLWFCEWWDSPDTVLESFTDKTAYPWHPYAREFDWIAVHRLWQEKEFGKAVKLFDKMLAEESHEDEQSEVKYWVGSCLVELGKTTKALAAFNESIRLDPGNSDAYRGRGKLYEQLGEKSKAEADLARAERLESE